MRADLACGGASSARDPLQTISAKATITHSLAISYFNPSASGRPWRFSGAKSESLPEEYKAWSQNLGHENVLTTFSSYGDVARHRQAEIIRSLGKSEQHACISSSSLIVLPAKGIFDGATS